MLARNELCGSVTCVLSRLAVASGVFFTVVLLGCLTFGQNQATQFEVGDLIEFEFHREKQQQIVIELTGSGWPRVEADLAGRKIRYVVLPGRATLIRRANAPEAPEKLPAEYRTWTDATGAFQVEATLLALTDTEVQLLKKDEKTITVALDKLSAADQAHLSEVRSQRAAEANPFEGGVPVGPGAARNAGSAVPGGMSGPAGKPTQKVFGMGELPIAGRSIKIAKEVAIDPVKFSYVPGPQRQHVADKSISLPPTRFSERHEFHTNRQLFQCGNSGELLVVYRTNPFEATSQAILIDSNSEEVFGDLDLPFKQVDDVIISPSKQTVVTIHSPFSRYKGGLVFWKQKNDQWGPDKAWEFDDSRQLNRFTAHSALFIDERHLFTIGSHLALWDLATDTCIYSVTGPGAWNISRDNSHIVFFNKGSLWIMRLQDGVIVGQIKGEPKFMASLGNLDLSPNGRSLVASSGGSLYGFDLTNGQSLFSFEPGYAIKTVVWADNSLLFVNNSQVVDPKLQVTVWNVLLPRELYRAQTGSTTWVVAPDRVFGIELINDNRRQEIAEITADLTAQDLLAFGPGTRISLSIELNHLGNAADRVARSLRDRVEKLGFVVDDSAPLRLEAVVLRGKEVQEVVRDGFGSILATQERIRYTPHSSHLRLKLKDELLWQMSANHTASGPILHIERNETPQAAATRLSRPNPAFFTNAAIPTKISRLPKGRLPGKSTITPAGLQ